MKTQLYLIFLLIASQIFAQDKYDSYQNEWVNVSALQIKQTPKSADSAVMVIAQRAKKDGNYPQSIKAILHHISIKLNKGEFQMVDAYKTLLNEAQQSKIEVEKAILYSYTASALWQYYLAQKWKITQRSSTVNFLKNDVATWSAADFERESLHLYLKSLEQEEILLKTPVSEIEPLILASYRVIEKSSVFDVLAYEAIEFFMYEQGYISKTENRFLIDNMRYFDNEEAFVRFNISTKDSTNFKFHGLRIFQRLTAAHLTSGDDLRLAETSINRLNWVKQLFVNHEKREIWYQEGLKRLYEAHKTKASAMFVAYHYHTYLHANHDQNNSKDKFEMVKNHGILKSLLEKHKNMAYAHYAFGLLGCYEGKELLAEFPVINSINQPILIKVNYRNTEKLFVKAIRIDSLLLREMRYKEEYSYSDIRRYEHSYKIDSMLLFVPAFKTWHIKWKDVGDMRRHSFEYPLEGLPAGDYLLTYSEDSTHRHYDFNEYRRKNYSTYDIYKNTLKVTDIAYTYRGNSSDLTNQVLVVNRKSGKPIQNASVEVFTLDQPDFFKSQIINHKQPKVIHSVYTNRDGIAEIPSVNRHHYYCKIKTQTDSFCNAEEFIQSPYGVNRNHESCYRRNQRENIYGGEIFTDRAIYRPGQTVYFKGIAFHRNEFDYRTASDDSLEVSLYNPLGTEIVKMAVRTNEFGSFSSSFVLPTTGLTGLFILSINHLTRTAFQVEEYKRPSFEIKFDTLNRNYKIGQQINVSGVALNYAGNPLQKATVKYRVIRLVQFPYWRYWCWWQNEPVIPSYEVSHGSLETDSYGKFTVDFNAVEDKTLSVKENPVYTYKVKVEVIDISGETHVSEVDVKVGYINLDIVFDMPEIINLDNIPPKYPINSLNINGIYTPAKGTIKISALEGVNAFLLERKWSIPDQFVLGEDSFKSIFPNLPYRNEYDVWNRRVLGLVSEIGFDTEQSKDVQLKDIIKKLPVGHYVVEIASKDSNGMPFAKKLFFDIQNPLKNQFASRKQFHVHLDKSTGKKGDVSCIRIGSKENVWILFESSNGIDAPKMEWLHLNNETFVKKVKHSMERDTTKIFQITCFYLGIQTSEEIAIRTHNAPPINTDLKLSFSTFRSKLSPGQKEVWRLKVMGQNNEKVSAEVMATLFDESLSAFKNHHWDLEKFSPFDPYRTKKEYCFFKLPWHKKHPLNTHLHLPSISIHGSCNLSYDLSYPPQLYNFYSPYQNMWHPMIQTWRRYNPYFRIEMKEVEHIRTLSTADMLYSARVAQTDEGRSDALNDVYIDGIRELSYKNLEQANSDNPVTLSNTDAPLQIRKNFNETAFFLPQLRTNESGEVIIEFTMPEALTKWHFMALAHTKSMESGILENTDIITQKELMVFPNMPRFLREGDKITLSTKISNLTEKAIDGKATLLLFDAFTMMPVDAIFKHNQKQKPFNCGGKQSIEISFDIEIPLGIQAVVYRITAESESFSDGEENSLPILSSRMLVTESLTLPIKGGQSKTYTFEKLKQNQSTTLSHQSLTLEVTSNPIWNAVKGLTYLMDYPLNCAEQTFSRVFANAIAQHILFSNPKIKEVFEQWRNTPALLSNLEQNQELKNILLEESPWVLSSQIETESRKRIALLFDINKIQNELAKSFLALKEIQQPSGALAWFKDCYPNRYITQHIVAGFGKLKHLEINLGINENDLNLFLLRAHNFLDAELTQDYNKMLKANNGVEVTEPVSWPIQLHYFYTRSFFKSMPVPESNKPAFDFYLKQLEGSTKFGGHYEKALAALALYRYGKVEKAKELVKSLKEYAIIDEEKGMYWALDLGYYWYHAPIEFHALMIEVFDEIENDTKSIDLVKTWIITQKQTQSWHTTKSTVEAIYSLLLRGTDFLSEEKPLDISIGGLHIDNGIEKSEVGTGHFKQTFQPEEIKPAMANVRITNPNKQKAWAGVYWQYFEDLDKITPAAETPLKIQKTLFVERTTSNGLVLEPISDNTKLKVGDLIKVRLELRTDRDMEYVHLKDMRASGLEPTNVLTKHKWQDGISYLENTRDASTNFFIDYLRKGTYVFEYPLRIFQAGEMSCGIAQIQCMYAPEFSAHSEGARIRANH